MPKPKKSPGKGPNRSATSEEVKAILKRIAEVLNLSGDDGRRASNAKWGVYAFYDYDGEPIYVGQTYEKLRSRIRRHLTNQRTDAVAMNVLDPYEVAEIEIWPLWDLEGENGKSKSAKSKLNSTEYTVYRRLLEASKFRAVLNEKVPTPVQLIKLPDSIRGCIVPDPVYERRKHSDIRVARRASTIAGLAQVISERAVEPGLRYTLLIQAQRLEYLANQRLEELGGMPEPSEEIEPEEDSDG